MNAGRSSTCLCLHENVEGQKGEEAEVGRHWERASRCVRCGLQAEEERETTALKSMVAVLTGEREG